MFKGKIWKHSVAVKRLYGHLQAISGSSSSLVCFLIKLSLTLPATSLKTADNIFVNRLIYTIDIFRKWTTVKCIKDRQSHSVVQ